MGEYVFNTVKEALESFYGDRVTAVKTLKELEEFNPGMSQEELDKWADAHPVPESDAWADAYAFSSEVAKTFGLTFTQAFAWVYAV